MTPTSFTSAVTSLAGWLALATSALAQGPTRASLDAAPDGRAYHAMAFDEARGRTVLFGGYRAGTGSLADTWEWDGRAWIRCNPATSPPALAILDPPVACGSRGYLFAAQPLVGGVFGDPAIVRLRLPPNTVGMGLVLQGLALDAGGACLRFTDPLAIICTVAVTTAAALAPRHRRLTALGAAPGISVMADDPSPTVALLHRWHGGDQEALGQLIELQLPWLMRHVQRRLGAFLAQHGEPADFLNEAVLDFLRSAPRFVVRDAQQLRALLVRVVENTLRDQNAWYRAQRRDMNRRCPLPTDSVLHLEGSLALSSTPSRAASREEMRAWVRFALELLAPEDRKVILLREYQDRSFVEIGEELGMTANAVRMRWVRAVARLAEEVQRLRAGRLEADPDPTP